VQLKRLLVLSCLENTAARLPAFLVYATEVEGVNSSAHLKFWALKNCPKFFFSSKKCPKMQNLGCNFGKI